MYYLDLAVSLGLLFAGGLLKSSTLAGLIQCSFCRNCDIMAALPLFVYNTDLLRSLNVCSSILRRATRKILFSFGLWRPSRQPQWTSKRIPSMLRQPESTHPNSVIRLATLTYGRSGQNMFRLRTSSQPMIWTSLQSQNHSILPQMMLQFGVRLPRAFHISIDRGLTLRMRPGEEVALSSTTRAVLVQKRLNCTGRRSRLKPSLSPSPSEVLSPFWQSIVRVLLNQLRHSLRSSQPCWSSLQSITSSWS